MVPETKTLKHRLWMTKGIRFSACRRFENKQRASSLALSVLSLYAIIIAVVCIIYPSIGELNELKVASIIVPVFILMLSQHEAGNNHAIKAERMRRSAQKIQELYLEYSGCDDDHCSSHEYRKNILDRYNVILNDFTANQDLVDYKYFLAIRRSEFNASEAPNLLKAYWFIFWYHVNVYGKCFLMVMVPLLICIFIGFKMAP